MHMLVYIIRAWLEGLFGQPNTSDFPLWSLAEVEAGNQTHPM